MIRAEFVLNGNLLCGFQISGHAGGVKGTDVVCAAVSSAAFLTANTITEILGIAAEIECAEGMLSCRVSESDAHKCMAVLGFGCICLLWPNNILKKLW